MSDRNSREAIESYADSIRETLQCVTHFVLGAASGVSPFGKIGTLNFLPEAIAPLSRTKWGLLFSQNYTCTQDSIDQLWKVRTSSYSYTVYDFAAEDEPREIFAYHWHPKSAVTIPHVHFKKGEPRITRTHLPTGRVPIESIVEFLIQDLGVKCRKSDWKAIIDRNRELRESAGHDA